MSTNSFPFRAVVIQGETAALFARAPKEFVTVHEAEQLDRVLSDPDNVIHCPLCNEFMGPYAFDRHAPSCIKGRAAAWERQRDREPMYADQKRFNDRTIFDVRDTPIIGCGPLVDARDMPLIGSTTNG